MSIAESLMSVITPSVVANASKYFGESSGATERGLSAATATALAGATRLAASDGGASLSALMRDHAVSDSMLGNIAGLFARTGNGSTLMNSGQAVLGDLLGSRTAETASALESFAGIKSSTATGMLSMAGPIVLGFLSRHQRSQALTNTGLASQLTTERDALVGHLPPGVANLVGIAAPLGTTTATGSARAAPHMMGFASGVATTARYGAQGNRWLIPLAILAGLIALAAWFSTRNARAPLPTVSDFASVRLPNGGSLALEPNSLNYNLATFLSKGSSAELPRTFIFDRLNFLSGTTQLTDDSAPTVTALASILKAYPNAAITLVGHTDNTGDAETNRKLSLDRANAVRDQLVSAGVDSARISTDGYGQDRPVASNDTEEGRAKNRRTELTITRM
jgi:OmpA-OmpF porin, OOP family